MRRGGEGGAAGEWEATGSCRPSADLGRRQPNTRFRLAAVIQVRPSKVSGGCRNLTLIVFRGGCPLQMAGTEPSVFEPTAVTHDSHALREWRHTGAAANSQCRPGAEVRGRQLKVHHLA